MSSERLSSGMTLMEVLVALTIVGMALALGFQALSQWDRAQAAFAGAERRSREAALAEAWIRESMRARILRPATRNPDGSLVEADTFVGSRTIVDLVTLSPLYGERGIPTKERWELSRHSDGWALVHSATSQPPLPLPTTEAPRFIYVDSAGKSHDRWPPTNRSSLPPGAPSLFGIAAGGFLWIEASDLRPGVNLNELPSE